MIEVHEKLYVGNETDCTDNLIGFGIIRRRTHVRAIGYQGSLPPTHPHYLFYAKDDNLYLNMIDPGKPLFKIEMFLKYMEFAKMKWDEGKSLLIHCNQGESRAPSLALLFMAKKLSGINSESFSAAREEFIPIYPAYNPGRGIQIFLEQNWHLIV